MAKRGGNVIYRPGDEEGGCAFIALIIIAILALCVMSKKENHEERTDGLHRTEQSNNE